jgi:anti-sigma B factor antagonist
MSLRLKSRKLDNVVVIDMGGRLTSGEPQLLFRNTIRRFLEDGNDRFVLNLSDVNYIDSSGLGELAVTKSALDNKGGRVNLLGLQKRVNDVLVLTKLACVFDFFDEESKAVAALRG